MASRGSPYNPHGTPKQIVDLTKTFAMEARTIMEQLQKLRDERTQLQAEVAELMALKAKHGGDLLDWRPKIEAPPVEPPPPPPAIEDVPQARPGWRVVHKRERKVKKAITAPPPPVGVPPPGVPAFQEPPPPPNVPAWAQWRPNPLLVPTPLASSSQVPASPPPRSGLFGASTPPPGGR